LKKSVFVISDLHLGGDVGFQMCPPEGVVLLEQFITGLIALQHGGQRVHLVINGDMVDFLAEKEFSAFTNDDSRARSKLERIIGSTSAVWARLRDLMGCGAELTVMLGNHDVELSFPGPRQLMFEKLRNRPEFLYDNQAFVEGQLLIEHGNRYDRWNVVSHAALRASRSAMSRREKPPFYPGPPGSCLVERAINPMKKDYPWIDLLKPENSGMLPVLAVLNPSAIRHLPALTALAATSMLSSFGDDNKPLDPRNIASARSANQLADEGLQLAMSLADIRQLQNISAVQTTRDFFSRFKAAVNDQVKRAMLKQLYTALRFFAQYHKKAFDTGHEDDAYRLPALASAKKGFQVIVFGHTHLAKQVSLPGGATYLNSGTWADLMRLPESIFGGEEEDAIEELAVFVDDLAERRTHLWRHRLATFAHIDLDQGKIDNSGVYIFRGPGQIERLPAQLTELARRTKML